MSINVKIVNIVKKIVKMLVRSCFLITLIKCLKGHKSLGSLCNVKSKSQWVSEWVSESVSQWQGHLLSCCGQLKMVYVFIIIDLICICMMHKSMMRLELPERRTHGRTTRCKELEVGSMFCLIRNVNTWAEGRQRMGGSIFNIDRWQ